MKGRIEIRLRARFISTICFECAHHVRNILRFVECALMSRRARYTCSIARLCPTPIRFYVKFKRVANTRIIAHANKWKFCLPIAELIANHNQYQYRTNCTNWNEEYRNWRKRDKKHFQRKEWMWKNIKWRIWISTVYADWCTVRTSFFLIFLVAAINVCETDKTNRISDPKKLIIELISLFSSLRPAIISLCWSNENLFTSYYIVVIYCQKRNKKIVFDCNQNTKELIGCMYFCSAHFQSISCLKCWIDCCSICK